MWLRNASRKSDVQIRFPPMARPDLGQTSSQVRLWFWGSGLLKRELLRKEDPFQGTDRALMTCQLITSSGSPALTKDTTVVLV